ncbi:MAG: efflux RND transporter periplasmic adaptor subunit [Lentisphaeria bacterium]|nr:efflux RND transporter periplasmic adaptor subunit [Lentisphaeria bacterium]
MKHPSSFLLLAAGFLCGLAACSKPEQDDAQAGTVYRIKVQTAQAQPRHFRKQIRVQGTVQAYIFADVAARSAGNMELLVEDGDAIKAGQTLFLIDQANLKNRVAMANQSLKVIEETYNTTRLDVDIAKTQLDKAQKDYDRNRRLHDEHAVSDNAFETFEVALDKAQKSYEKAEAVLRYTAAKVDQVKLELAIATKDLSDATEKAPYDGVVAVKYRENGEFINRGVNVIRINDPRKLRAACLISAVYFEAIKPGETPVTVSFHGKTVEAKADWCSPVIDPLSRTFTMRSYLPEGTPLMDGMLVDVDILLAERDGTGVPRDAVILKKGGKSAVFAAQDGKAREIEVETGIASDGFIEILNPDAIEGKDIIVSGQYFVNDGSAVTVTNAK